MIRLTIGITGCGMSHKPRSYCGGYLGCDCCKQRDLENLPLGSRNIIDWTGNQYQGVEGNLPKSHHHCYILGNLTVLGECPEVAPGNVPKSHLYFYILGLLTVLGECTEVAPLLLYILGLLTVLGECAEVAPLLLYIRTPSSFRGISRSRTSTSIF